MHIVVVYDSEQSVKMNKILKKYLVWKQNSVFDGQITESKLKKMIEEIKKIKNDTDSVLIYSSRETLNETYIGVVKNNLDFII